MKIDEINHLKVGMWVKTKTNLIAKVKRVDLKIPLDLVPYYPVIQTDDENKTCWSCDSIEEYGWEIN